VKDFARLNKTYIVSGKHHSGIVVSDHLTFSELLRRILTLLLQHPKATDLADQFFWLQD